MKWIDFFMWSAFLYALYYAVNIAMDVGKGNRRGPVTVGDNILHFSEHVVAADAAEAIPPLKPPVQKISAAPRIPPSTPVKQIASDAPIEGAGVTIKELVALAQMDAVDYIKNISFPS